MDGNLDYRIIFNAISNGMAITEFSSGKIIDVNIAWGRSTGIDRERSIGKTAFELGLWASQAERDACLAELGKNGHITDFRVDLIMRSVKLPHLISGQIIEISGKRYVLWEFRDITEQARMNKAIQDAERKIRAVFDQSFQFIGIMTLEGILIEANRTAMQFAGINESDCLGKPFWDTPWWTHSKEMQDKLRKAVIKVALGETVRFEATHIAADGSTHYIDFSLKPVKDEYGKMIFMVPEGRDITERKKLEEEDLKHAQELEIFYKASVGREERIIELKKEVENLKEKMKK